jgi:predicted TIM-barrel fold metal-dependent hydrolase
MRDQLLDPCSVAHAILTGHEGLAVAGLTNPYFAAEVARALDDLLIEQWLAADPRLKGSVALACQVPEHAAAEIRRVAGHPQIVQAAVSTNPHAYPFGHPIYDPIHRACAETGLVFAIHALGDGAAGAIPSQLASGFPTLYLEFHAVGAAQGLQTHLASFVFHGVFDRYPDLRLVLIEGGAAWLPAFLARLDVEYKGLRREVPWCKRLPSEYVREHVRVTTQPFELTRQDDPLLAALEAVGGRDILVYSSDYPHWDTDGVGRVAAALPAGWRDAVLRANAAELYDLAA